MRRRKYTAVAVLTAVASTLGPMARPEPYAAPGPVPELTGAASLTGRYAAVERDIRRARQTARRSVDTTRAETLTGFLAPGRRFLAFDPRGRGRAVEVNGDLARAERIAVVVPGADGALGNFDSPKWAGGGARALYRRAAATAPGARPATVGWLGYGSPSTLDLAVLTDGRAEDGARALARFVTAVHRVNPGAGIALLCHSYGSVVCAKAGPRLEGSAVDQVALYGSPGVDVRAAAAFKGTARIWTARSGGDWTRFIPKVRFAGIGFGPDPVTLADAPASTRPGAPPASTRPSTPPASTLPRATRFEAGGGAHSAYLRPGSISLRNLTRIALGHDSEVTGD